MNQDNHNRVKLSAVNSDELSTYINASFVQVVLEQNTVFWNYNTVIWNYEIVVTIKFQKNIQFYVIVFVSNFNELVSQYYYLLIIKLSPMFLIA